jgi:hypothetical protein
LPVCLPASSTVSAPPPTPPRARAWPKGRAAATSKTMTRAIESPFGFKVDKAKRQKGQMIDLMSNDLQLLVRGHGDEGLHTGAIPRTHVAAAVGGVVAGDSDPVVSSRPPAVRHRLSS